MTEAEWLACSDLKRMLRLVRVKRRLRKLRLFAVANFARNWELITDQDCRNAVIAAERLADGQITNAEVVEHQNAAIRVANARAGITGNFRDLDDYAFAAHLVLITNGEKFAGYVYQVTWMTLKREYSAPAEWQRDVALKADLLREIYGNAYRPVSIEPGWLIWNDGAVRKIAQAIYEDRAFDRMPILADALEEAGCTNADILSHCRGDGPHVRGCWVVDLLLGKE